MIAVSSAPRFSAFCSPEIEMDHPGSSSFHLEGCWALLGPQELQHQTWKKPRLQVYPRPPHHFPCQTPLHCRSHSGKRTNFHFAVITQCFCAREEGGAQVYLQCDEHVVISQNFLQCFHQLFPSFFLQKQKKTTKNFEERKKRMIRMIRSFRISGGKGCA